MVGCFNFLGFVVPVVFAVDLDRHVPCDDQSEIFRYVFAEMTIFLTQSASKLYK